jgi:hypothetical protein
MYFTGSAIGVALTVGYVLVIIAIGIAMLCFMLYILAKVLEG